jgi:hypothetical protein
VIARVVTRLVAAALVAAAAVIVLPSPTAYAGACSTNTGVTVVVDFNQLGGGVQQACVAGGGGDTASSLFPAAGFSLTYASRQPGFVCRVNDVPQSDPCVNTAPADAFWSLWWSKGNGSWSYASIGVGSLKVPDGGFVAFSWDQVSGSEPPSAGATTPAAPAPSPTPTPTPSPEASGGNNPGQPAAPGGTTPPGSSPSVSPDGSPSASPGDQGDRSGKGDRRGKGKQKKPKASPGAAPTAPESTAPVAAADDGSTTTEPPADSGGLPGWVAPALIGVLFAAAGVVMLVRRRRSGTVSP